MTDDKVMIAPEGKGFTVYRGDSAILENGKIKGTLYDIGKSLRPSIGRSWTTSRKTALKFACQYAEDKPSNIVPIIYHGTTHRMEKGLFWDSEREVHIRRDKSRLKSIEIVEKSDCETIMEELSR